MLHCKTSFRTAKYQLNSPQQPKKPTMFTVFTNDELHSQSQKAMLEAFAPAEK